ncbi:uncharacterized protein LOC128920505 [Zeugodacus cucurbitae]|uniref:uncharacterized protein LOC128920505 n=1 Tax=Zeugodacus cucurbitae TaxID=28588 RepID=UPI0023D91119|nr:uncharacterized protein LOC128920505 [Zeugodacus cucurbitae]
MMSTQHSTEYTDNTTRKKWQRWCRLCAKCDGQYFDIFVKESQTRYSQQQLVSTINKCFQIQIQPCDGLPVLLCAECYTFINYMRSYTEHVIKVQAMYQDLLHSTYSPETDVKAIYEKYGILKFEPYVQQHLPETVRTTTPTAIEQIFVKDDPVLTIKAEDMEEWQTTVRNLETEIKIEFPEPFANNTTRSMQELSEDSEEDTDLLNLLKEFDLETLFLCLKNAGITFRSLKYLSKEDIAEAVKNIGLRAEFREKLFFWRKSKFGIEDETLSQTSKVVGWLEKTRQKDSPCSSNNSIRNAFGSQLLSTFLNDNSAGKQLIQYYEEWACFTNKQRDALIKIILEDVMLTKTKLRPEHFASIVEEIIGLFPNEKECQNYYYIPRQRKNKPIRQALFQIF